MNGLDRMTERLATPRLHFHERHFIAASHDEVDIAMPAAETMRDERPSVAPHPSRGNAFAHDLVFEAVHATAAICTDVLSHRPPSLRLG